MSKADTVKPEGPLAYLITFRCYGTWLHGDLRHSMDRSGNHTFGSTPLAPDAARESRERRSLRHPPTSLTAEMRRHVDEAVRDTCRFRHWRVFALNVQPDHIHVVVSAPEHRPERVMTALKAWATRRLRVKGLAERDMRLWSRHGSTRYLWNDAELGHALAYVVEGQALPPQMQPALPGWIEAAEDSEGVSK